MFVARSSIVLYVLLMLMACCAQRSQRSLMKAGVKVSSSERIGLSTQRKTVDIQYLGCGGVFIRSAAQAIMIDPYFSHQPFMKIGKSILLNSKLKPDRKQLLYGKRMIQDSLHLTDAELKEQVKGIFSAHGHYDHLMDIPFIHHEWLDEAPEVFMNTSSMITCRNVVAAEKLNNIEDIAAIRNQPGDSIEFVNKEAKIRVYPIFADHNPHSRNIKLFAGSATKTPEHLKRYDSKTHINDWLEGQTLSFLIDIVEGDSVRFRIFLQSSSCQFPDGIPPDALLNEKEVDLAILGIASYHFSENTYPCEFVKKIRPTQLMFIHWEDFFSKNHRKQKAVRKNNIPRFFNEVFSRCEMSYILPVPGSVITIGY